MMESELIAIAALIIGLVFGSVWKGDDVVADCHQLGKARISGKTFECREVK